MPNIELLLPYLRTGTAVLPFVFAMLCRLLFGQNRLTRFMVSASTTWFAINVLLAPFTDLDRLSAWLR